MCQGVHKMHCLRALLFLTSGANAEDVLEALGPSSLKVKETS